MQCHEFIPNELTENNGPCFFFPGACTREALCFPNPWHEIAYRESLLLSGGQ